MELITSLPWMFGKRVGITHGYEYSYLSKGLQHLLALTEMAKEQMQRSGHQRCVVVHDEMQQHTQECASPLTIQIQIGRIAALTIEDALCLHTNRFQIDILLTSSRC